MIARVASFEGVNVQQAERTMEEAESIVRPIVESLPGYEGNLELVSANGKVLSITLFDLQENAEGAEQTFDGEMPRRLGDLFAGWEGRRVSVDLYKVVGESHK